MVCVRARAVARPEELSVPHPNTATPHSACQLPALRTQQGEASAEGVTEQAWWGAPCHHCSTPCHPTAVLLPLSPAACSKGGQLHARPASRSRWWDDDGGCGLIRTSNPPGLQTLPSNACVIHTYTPTPSLHTHTHTHTHTHALPPVSSCALHGRAAPLTSGSWSKWWGRRGRRRRRGGRRWSS